MNFYFIILFASITTVNAFTVFFPIEDKSTVKSLVKKLPSDALHEFRENTGLNRIELVFSDSYFYEVQQILISGYPQHVAKLNDQSRQLYIFSDLLIEYQGDFLEALIRSNAFPDRSHLVQNISQEEVEEEINRVQEISPVKIKCDPRNNKVMQEFIMFGRHVTSSLDQRLNEASKMYGVNRLRLFVVGGSMESYFHYLKAKGSDVISKDQISFLPISRDLFRKNSGKTSRYLQSLIGYHINQGEKVILFDTLWSGETFLTLRSLFDKIGAQSQDTRWNRILLLGAPEVSFDDPRMLKIRDKKGIERTQSLRDHLKNNRSFLEVIVPLPGEFSHNGAKYAFGESEHFIRGKYTDFTKNGYPLNLSLYPDRMNRHSDFDQKSLCMYRAKKCAAILQILKLDNF